MEYSYILTFFISLILGVFAGFIMHRSDYCIAGMFRDLFLFKRTFMIKTLVLLIVSSMALFEVARQTGILKSYPFPLLYSPTLANVLGGFIFGIGMVLAGGCVIGTLYKMGAGSILSAVAFAGLIAGSALYAEIYPGWASFIKETTFFRGKITISQILGIEPLLLISIAVAAGISLLILWGRKSGLVRASYVDGYLQPWKAALCLAFIGATSYVLIGMPVGVTSSYVKISAYIESFLTGEHFETLAYFKTVPLKYVHPLTNVPLQGGLGTKFDALSAIQFPLVIGILFGSALSAFMLKEFHVRFRLPARQYLSAFAGGVIMGMASRMAPTCNVWHLLGGLPILAASSLLFLAGLIPGAWLGSRIFVNIIMTKKRREE